MERKKRKVSLENYSYCDPEFLKRLCEIHKHVDLGNEEEENAKSVRENVGKLFKFGSDVNTPLPLQEEEKGAAGCPFLTIVGGGVNCEDQKESALHRQKLALLQLLTCEGFDVNCPNMEGVDPLVLEEVLERFSILRMLLSSGTDVNSDSQNRQDFCVGINQLLFGYSPNNDPEPDPTPSSTLLNLLLLPGLDVNSVKCCGEMLSPYTLLGDDRRRYEDLTRLLVSTGDGVNGPC